jgi:hypothetical protein
LTGDLRGAGVFEYLARYYSVSSERLSSFSFAARLLVSGSGACHTLFGLSLECLLLLQPRFQLVAFTRVERERIYYSNNFVALEIVTLVKLNSLEPPRYR